MRKSILSFILCLIIFGLTGCSSEPQTIGLGDSVEYKGFKITIGSNYKVDRFVNDPEFIVPISFENISDDTKALGMSFTAFGPTGSEMSMFEPSSTTKVKPGGKYSDDLDVIASDGDGTYTIEIDNSNISIVIDFHRY